MNLEANPGWPEGFYSWLVSEGYTIVQTSLAIISQSQSPLVQVVQRLQFPVIEQIPRPNISN